MHTLGGIVSAVMPLGKRAMDMHGHMSGGGMSMMGDKAPEEPVQLQFPAWFWIVCVVLFFVFLPFLFFVSYTLNNLLPALVMIEDPSPPAYEPLSGNADDPETPAAAPKNVSPVTASIRETFKLLRSISGFRSLFRGFWALFFASIAMSATQNLFAAFIPTKFLKIVVAPLPAILVTLPLLTAWTHIVMSAPQSVVWYRRLPSMKKSFAALWRPAVIYWAAVAVATVLISGLVSILGISRDALLADDSNLTGLGWKTTVAGIVSLVLGLALIVPAHVLFTRVQASLLPVEDEPIIAFDRSFGGRVEPEVVGGKGYASVADAWSTFTKEAWMRLIKLYVKVIGISIALWIVIAAVFVPIFIVASKQAKRVDGGN